MNKYENILESQRKYLSHLGTIDEDKRIDNLKKLKKVIKKYENEIIDALNKDLGKHIFEAYSNEVGFVYGSIDFVIKNLKTWARVKKVKNDAAQLPGKSYIYKSHYGAVLIIGPYNYPFQLTIEPLIGAIAGGNTVILKPSEYATATEAILEKIIKEIFDEEYIAVVTGDYKVNSDLLDLEFDYIFFTGSVNVGKIVMEKASKHLTPVTLELGGKSPVIVDNTADLKISAKRILWGKLTNAGQTCVAPDYLLAHEHIYEELIEELKNAIVEFYGNDIINNKEFGRIINDKHMNRLNNILENDKDKIVVGGEVDFEQRYISPTILRDVTLEDSVMQDEIFGPILPVIKYENLEDLKYYISKHKNPLALYVFSENDDFSEDMIRRFTFGGGCVNDTISHVASAHLPFGGVGTSGMGNYHGKASFDTFTHTKSIVKKSTKIDLKLVFPPYKKKVNLIKKIMK
ncbi:aldehyde dehydrogenase [Terrisporobacter mayombei]|uniref:Aldehyde dehydrogenase n=1 Tax=Terrisporobacter mayombei TaxID=1541 RepID=A0ABY9Q049_9FIRM|nr:aldehyde dehydrogenase [Terrisporobacter mayombei]MCC3868240.1 aldehyde dehydrogenase [Terrisporobacter mayombei]WMT80380.1 4,4'-diaponeurosporen-aldehyde dehydrogenase [Terrisporobacter mayombei]